MERQHIGTTKDGLSLWGGYDSNHLRSYYDQKTGGSLVALAASSDGFNNFTNYHCLPGIWDQGSDTCWASKSDLDRIREEVDGRSF
jgi:hypothetical protein